MAMGLPGKAQAHSIWLCPDAAGQALAGGWVARLCARTGAPVFAPHVTLLGDLHGMPRHSFDLCGHVALPSAIRARVTGLAQTEAFFMALFLDLELDPDPAPGRVAIARALGRDAGPFRPHLSLAYGQAGDYADPAIRAAIERDFLGATLVLDAVAVVASARDVPIEDWREVHRRGL